MEKDTLHSRLAALDGLRGFAIILVFLNHINTSFVQNILPRNIFGWLFTNGVTGVTFLFILSGFLMSSIYPNPPSSLAFLQKRYIRIFPLFLTMSAVMFVGGLTNTKSPFVLLDILFGFALLTYIVWVFVIKKLPNLVGRIVFFSFIGLQVCAGLLYVFWINKLSFLAFSSLPTLLHQGLIYLINATLTLPLGQYVPMLDGVYWTLVAEVLFYVLYPTLIVPLSKYLAHKSLKTKILFLLCLIPLFGGMHMLSYKIFVLSLIQPALFFYFATGVFLGYVYRNHTVHIEKFSKKMFKGYLTIVPFFLFWVTVAGVNDLSFLGQTISPWIRMIFAIPLTFLTAVLLDKETLFSKFFSTKILAYIGTVSYSIYLSHSLIIHISSLITQPKNIIGDISYIAVVFTLTVGIASILFFLLERPYFHKKGEKKKAKKIQQSNSSTKVHCIFTGVSLVYLFAVFAAYQSSEGYNFFSYAKNISQNEIRIDNALPKQNIVTFSAANTAHITIPTTNNNLGLISIKLLHHRNSHITSQQLLFSIVGNENATYSATYNLDEFNYGKTFPFGFPVIKDSAEKKYIVTLILTNPKSPDTLQIDTNSVQAVYALDKKELLKNPKVIASLLFSKVATVFTTLEALFAFLLLLPFFVFSLLA